MSNESQISTFSQEFIDAYSYQREFNWNGREMVQMTTLDNLIDKYGIPDFCKIDIEGYEKEALRGLSHLIPLISIEFNYPLKYLAIECLDIVKKFEPVVTNYVKFETPRFELDQWVDIKQMKKIVSDMTPDIKTGDIYIRKLES